MSRPASEGWERWPAHTDLITGQWLCRWCHKPLDGRKTSWCSKACELEVIRRCNWDSARRVLYERQQGVCQRCGLDTKGLSEAISAYGKLHQRHTWLFGKRGDGLSRDEIERRLALVAHWPEVKEFIKAIGKAASRWPGALWEANHKTPIVEGGALCDQENLETLCLACHADDTAGVIKRVAEARRAKAVEA